MNSPLHYSIHTRLREYHLRRLMPTPPAGGSGRFLDVGCGVGYLTTTLGQGFLQVGVDIDHQGLHNQKRDGGAMVQASAAQLPFAAQSFDVILCSELLEHLPEPLDRHCLAEMARLLKPAGRLLVTVPALEGWRATSRLRNLGHDDPSGGEYHHRMGYRWPQMAPLIVGAGLKVCERRESMFVLAEWFMDLLKWVYFRKNPLKNHSDLLAVKQTPLFALYRTLFPLLRILFILEDRLLARFFRGHIHILALERDAL